MQAVEGSELWGEEAVLQKASSGKPTSSLLVDSSGCTALLLCTSVRTSMLWVPSTVALPPLVSVSGGWILPITALPATHSLLALGMSSISGLLLSVAHRGTVGGTMASQGNRGHAEGYALGVLSGLPAGTLDVSSAPLATSLLLALAKCRSEHAVQLGKRVIHALYKQHVAIWPVIEELEGALKELLEQKHREGKQRDEQERESRNEQDDSEGGGEKHVTIDADSPAVAAIFAIASLPERLGLIRSAKPKAANNKSSANRTGITNINRQTYRHPNALHGLTYAVLLKFLFEVDALLFCELTSSLGRKLEPDVAKTILPFALQSPWDKSVVIRSPLSLFEECLSQGLLTYAARYLTLACEHVGGTASFHSSLECISLALELASRLLQRSWLPLALECLEFCTRLEGLVCSMVTVERARRHNGKRRSSAANNENSAGASGLHAYWLKVSPTLTHYLGGGALWTAMAEIDNELHAEFGEAGNRTSEIKSKNKGKGNQRDENDDGFGSYDIFLAVKHKLGKKRFDEILGLGDVEPSSQGKSFTSALLAITCEKQLRQHCFYSCGMSMLALLTSDKTVACVLYHIHAIATTATNTSITALSLRVGSQNDEAPNALTYASSIISPILKAYELEACHATAVLEVLDQPLGYVNLKKRCGEEAGPRSPPLHGFEAPLSCYATNGAQTRAQLLRGLILACLLADQVPAACVLTAMLDMPFTAAAIYELRSSVQVQATTSERALQAIQATLVEPPCSADSAALRQCDQLLFGKAEEEAGQPDAPTEHLRRIMVATGIRSACTDVPNLCESMKAIETYLLELGMR